jgi:hypothetical protein
VCGPFRGYMTSAVSCRIRELGVQQRQENGNTTAYNEVPRVEGSLQEISVERNSSEGRNSFVSSVLEYSAVKC